MNVLEIACPRNFPLFWIWQMKIAIKIQIMLHQPASAVPRWRSHCRPRCPALSASCMRQSLRALPMHWCRISYILVNLINSSHLDGVGLEQLGLQCVRGVNVPNPVALNIPFITNETSQIYQRMGVCTERSTWQELPGGPDYTFSHHTIVHSGPPGSSRHVKCLARTPILLNLFKGYIKRAHQKGIIIPSEIALIGSFSILGQVSPLTLQLISKRHPEIATGTIAVTAVLNIWRGRRRGGS